MSIFDRFLLAVYSLALTVILFLVAAEAVGLAPLRRLYSNISPSQTELLCVVGVAILIGLRLFWVSFRSSEQKVQSGRYVILSEGASGQIRVAVHAIENLVMKTASKMDGIKEVKTQIYSNDKGVGVRIEASVSPDLSIPDATEKIQTLVKERVLEVTGITVINVAVSVENIVVEKPRVE